MKEIYNKIAETGYKKTVNLDKYNNLIIVIRDHWDRIYNFYSKNNVQKLELDTFIHKKRAIHKIVRKIVPKNNKKHNFKYDDKLLCSKEKYDKIIKKPTLISFGKENGKTTISSLKNTGPKGPINTLAKELSKFTTVMLNNEYNTSQICPICNEQKVIHPIIKKTYKKYKLVNGEKVKCEVTRDIENYKLCYCENNNKHPHNEGSHNLWFNRDYVGGLNQINRMKLLMTGLDLGLYKREKEEKPLEIYWSQDQGGYDTVSPKKKKVITTRSNREKNKSGIRTV